MQCRSSAGVDFLHRCTISSGCMVAQYPTRIWRTCKSRPALKTSLPHTFPTPYSPMQCRPALCIDIINISAALQQPRHHIRLISDHRSHQRRLTSDCTRRQQPTILHERLAHDNVSLMRGEMQGSATLNETFLCSLNALKCTCASARYLSIDIAGVSSIISTTVVAFAPTAHINAVRPFLSSMSVCKEAFRKRQYKSVPALLFASISIFTISTQRFAAA